MVKKVMKSNEKRAVKAENAERRHRNLILAAVALRRLLQLCHSFFS